MADIKLQPTDRCILDYGTTTVKTIKTTIKPLRNIQMTRWELPNFNGDNTTYIYDASNLRYSFTEGKIISCSISISNPVGTTVSNVSFTDNSYTFSCAYRAGSVNQGTTLLATGTATIEYEVEESVQDKREVFQIYDDEGKMLWCKHKPVYVVFDESQIAMVEMDETDDRGGGGLAEFTESGEEGLIPAGWVWTIHEVKCRDGYELDTIEFNGIEGTTIDLTDISNLTLDDFDEVEIAVYAKAAAAVDPAMREIDPTCIDLQAGEGYLDTRSITTEIREYIDWNEDYDLIEGPRGEDVFMAYGYLENNEGKVVPVIYKTDYSNEDVIDEGCPPDYQDQYFYVGQAVLDGVTYDKWRKIDGETLTWDGDAKKYLYTNVITVDKTITILAPEILSATSLYREENSDWRIEVGIGNPNEQDAQLFISYQSASSSEWHRAVSTTISGLSQNSYSFTTAFVSAGADTPIKAYLQIGDITSEETFGEVRINS